MARHHSSFLLRCWDLDSDREERIGIDHIQSGAKVLTRSVADATEWICAHSSDTAGHDAHDSGATNLEGHGLQPSRW